MRYKVVPPVRSMSFLREAGECLPLVPGTVEDCCSRIRDGTDLDSRDEAREFLTFLQALGLAAEAEGGFYRPRESPTEGELADAFLERVYGAREVRECVAEAGPLAPDDVFERCIVETVPRWERNRDQNWRANWRERTERLLGWGVVLGHLQRTDDGRFRPTD